MTFMNPFKSTYYYFTFNTRVASYEVDQQPPLQAVIMKAGLCPLFGILNCAERAHFGVSNIGEMSARASGGGVASVVIPGKAYLRPAMIFRLLQKKFGTVRRTSIMTIVVIGMALTNAGMVVGRMQLLMSSASLIVILLATIIIIIIIIVLTVTADNLSGIAYSKFASSRHRWQEYNSMRR